MTMIRAGKLTEQVTFERREELVQPSGSVEIQWVAEATLRAELVQEGAEAFLGSVERVDDRKVFRLWRAAWIDHTMRLTHDGQTYRIAKIIPMGAIGVELHCVNGADEAAQ